LPKRKRVLVASTSEVYGKSPEVPFREDLIAYEQQAPAR
jgi:nucleoside-diphosphate-sugar epimerase